LNKVFSSKTRLINYFLLRYDFISWILQVLLPAMQKDVYFVNYPKRSLLEKVPVFEVYCKNV